MDIRKAVDQVDDDGNERFTVTVTEHKGPFRKVVPCLPMPLAGLCCLINVFVPGFGTIIAALSTLCCSTLPHHVTRSRALPMNLLAGFLQFITFPLVVGCVWSIIWGLLFIQIAQEKKLEEEIMQRRKREALLSSIK
ncbi:putative transmembrane protein C1orf95 -like protein [Toxocara canis]|uniref:Putative transmembrane protein C1orf95-like protein n=1 Tax=Toxocara canis TaxID=6265 RepID=A0A0B2VD87_TOXCA|nr:putative transmembrane protein C1orf95 -like protein [Toxocara canis]